MFAMPFRPSHDGLSRRRAAPAAAPRLAEPAMIGLALALAMAPAARSGDAAFALSEDQLDTITAAGVALIAESFAVSAGYGPTALTSSINDATADPRAGTANAFGFGAGPAGSDGSGSASVTGDGGAGAAYVASQADGFSSDARPTLVIANGRLDIGAERVSGGSGAVRDSGQAFTGATAGLSASTSRSAIEGAAASDGFSVKGQPSEAAATLKFQRGGSGTSMKLGATASGDDLSVAAANARTVTSRGGITMDIRSSGEAAAGKSATAEVAQVVIHSGGVSYARASGAAHASGGPAFGPRAGTSITLNASPDQVIPLGRDSLRGGAARSTTLLILAPAAAR